MTFAVASPEASSPLTSPSLLPGPSPAQSGSKQRPWKALALLLLLVLAVHAWLLATSPSRISPAGLALPPAMETRRIEPAPPPPPAVAAPEAVAAAPVPPPVVKTVVKPVSKPVLKPKRPPAKVIPAPAATELIASSESSPDAAPATPAAENPGSDAAKAAADALAATAAVAAANAPPEAPEAPAAPASAAVPALPETTAVTAMALPPSAELKYKATGLYKGLTYHATSELAWFQDGTSYSARVSVAAFLVGSRVLTSTGQIGAAGLAPTRFADKARSEVAAHFDADKAQVTFSANTPTVPWIKGTQDRASVFVQLAGMLAGNPAAFPAGSRISLYTVGPRSADVWTFTVGAEETIQLPAGEMKVVKLTQKPRGEYDRLAELWLAPSLGYLPARSKITQADGDFVDQQLSEVKRF